MDKASMNDQVVKIIWISHKWTIQISQKEMHRSQ